jgi:hypothetical protein
LHGRLAHFGRRVRVHLMLESIARVLAMTIGILLLSFVLDRVFRLGLPSRIFFIAVAAAFIVWQVRRHIVFPLRTSLDPIDLAVALDRRSPKSTIVARVASVLQLPDLLSHERPPSESMIRRAVHRSYESLGGIDFKTVLDTRRRNTALAVILGVALVPVLCAVAFPSSTSLWAKRWLMGSSQGWPQKTYLTVAGLEDGRILVARGEPHALRVGIQGNSVDPGSVSLAYRIGGGKKTTGSMNRFGPRDYRFDIPPLQQEATVELFGGDDEFGPFRIEPIDRPRVVELNLSAWHPTQPAADLHRFSGADAEMAFLPKTRLELTLIANVPLREVRMSSSTPHPATSDLLRVSDRAFKVSWTHESAVQLSFELVGAVGEFTSVPLPVSIGLKADVPPRVTLLYTGVRQRITPQARVPLIVQSRDDYGLAKVELAKHVELSQSLDAATQPSATQPSKTRDADISLFGPVSPASQLEAQQKHEFEVAAEQLEPGGLLTFTAKATDACYIGTQTGASRSVTFRVVAPEELFREILLRQQAERGRFRKAITESEKIRADLLSAAAPDAVAPLAKQHRLTQRESARIANALAESLTEMQLNALGGPEAWNLMENGIVKPLRALNDGLMTEQRDSLDGLSKSIDPQRMSETTARQDQILGEMNSILKQMSQWDSFVDVINQLNEIIKLQDTVRQNTEKIKEKQTEGVFE